MAGHKSGIVWSISSFYWCLESLKVSWLVSHQGSTKQPKFKYPAGAKAQLRDLAQPRSRSTPKFLMDDFFLQHEELCRGRAQNRCCSETTVSHPSSRIDRFSLSQHRAWSELDENIVQSRPEPHTVL